MLAGIGEGAFGATGTAAESSHWLLLDSEFGRRHVHKGIGFADVATTGHDAELAVLQSADDVNVLAARPDLDGFALGVLVTGREHVTALVVQPPLGAAGFARAGGSGFGKADRFVDGGTRRLGKSLAPVQVQPKGAKFLLDLADLERSARYCGNGGRNSPDRRLDQIAPTVANRGEARRRDAAVDLLIEQRRISAAADRDTIDSILVKSPA
jgi:hypothetical protein